MRIQTPPTEEDLATSFLDEVFTRTDTKSNNEVKKSILKSIDRKCIFDKNKQNNLLRLSSEDKIFSGTGVSPDGALVFGNIELSCFSKFSTILGFVFDNMFSLSDLIEAFRDDEPFKTNLDELVCLNNYAVRHNYIDKTVYPDLEHNLVNQTEDACDTYIKELRIEAKEMATKIFGDETFDDDECLKAEELLLSDKIFFKYMLLIPANISEEQKEKVKKIVKNMLLLLLSEPFIFWHLRMLKRINLTFSWLSV